MFQNLCLYICVYLVIFISINIYVYSYLFIFFKHSVGIWDPLGLKVSGSAWLRRFRIWPFGYVRIWA